MHQGDVLSLIIAIKQLHKASNGLWSPAELSLAQTGEKLPDIGILENTQVRMGIGESYFTLPRTLLEKPLAPTETQPLATTSAEANILSDDLPTALRTVIESILPIESPNIELVVDAAGISVRTLERRLAQQQLTYSKILADARIHLASKWLHDDSVSVKRIAYSLGYQDPSNFSRAFRRSTGISPQKYRLQTGGIRERGRRG